MQTRVRAHTHTRTHTYIHTQSHARREREKEKGRERERERVNIPPKVTYYTKMGTAAIHSVNRQQFCKKDGGVGRGVGVFL